MCYNRKRNVNLPEKGRVDQNKMKFYKHLYIGESIKNPGLIKWKLKHHAGQLSIYVIALAFGTDQLEIYHNAILQQTYYKKNPPFIIGIGGSYEEALELVKGIVECCYARNHNLDLKTFLSSFGKE